MVKHDLLGHPQVNGVCGKSRKLAVHLFGSYSLVYHNFLESNMHIMASRDLFCLLSGLGHVRPLVLEINTLSITGSVITPPCPEIFLRCDLDSMSKLLLKYDCEIIK